MLQAITTSRGSPMPDLYDELFPERDPWETEPDWWEIARYNLNDEHLGRS